jgi:hypothetical protein
VLSVGAKYEAAWQAAGGRRRGCVRLGVLSFSAKLHDPILGPSADDARIQTGSAGLFTIIALYGIARLLELIDWQLAAIVSTGGHPWKHLAAAALLLCCVS